MSEYVFDVKTKQLITGGNSQPCLPGGIGKLLFEKLRKHSEEGLIAQIDANTGYEYTFKELLLKSIKLAIYMQKTGIVPGDIILYYERDCFQSIVIFLACLFIGAIYSALDVALSEEQTIAMLKMLKAKIMFVSEDKLQRIDGFTCVDHNHTKVILINQHQKHNKYTSLDCIFSNVSKVINDSEGNSEEMLKFSPVYIADLTKTVLMTLTTGSTGLPKATCKNHNYLYSSLVITDPPPKQLLIFYYGNPFWGSCIEVYIGMSYFGLKKLTSPNASVNGTILWDLVEKYQVQAMYLSYYLAVDALSCLKQPLECVLGFWTTGAQLTVDKQLVAAKMLPNAVCCFPYGITEVGNVSKCCDPKSTSVGKPTHNNQVIKIVDPLTEQALDLGVIGEIRVKSKYPMNGYYKANSIDCFDEDGFFKTGDLGYLNTDFELFVEGRLAQTFKCDGTFVIPKIIETHLETHPEVQQCVVIGVRVKNSQIVVDLQPLALVVLKPGCSITTEELLKFSNDKMDYYHQLRAGIKIVDKTYIPFTSTGKINRNLLQAKIFDDK